MALACVLALSSVPLQAQNNFLAENISNTPKEATESSSIKTALAPVLPKYYNQQDGLSVNELIERALTSNQEIVASRLEIDRAQARLNQARLRPNPTLEVEQSSGAAIGSPGGGQFNVGASFPLEIYGRRAARIDQAQIAIEASRADVRNRERLLISGILTNYAEALAALRDLEITERLLELDLQTTSVVQTRVNEGDVAPLELNLLQAEVERLRARRQLAEGKLQAAYTQLKSLSGIPFEDTLRLREQINSAQLPVTPQTPEIAVTTALASRPDVRLTQIEEQVATAGLRLIRAQSRPDLTVYTRYTQGRLGFDNLSPTRYPSRDRTLAFGVAVALPVFNKNQGAKAEAEIAIRQAQARREYAERIVRGEILTAYQRLESARRAVETLETRALPRTTENVETFRRVYEVGNITISELINEQRRLLDTTRELSDALTQRYRAQIDLNIALGGAGFLPEPQ